MKNKEQIVMAVIILAMLGGIYYIYQDKSNSNRNGNGNSVTFETNAGNEYGTYVTGTWIKVDTDANGQTEKYVYSSTTSTGSCIGLPLLTTNSITMNKYTGSQGTSVILCNPTSNGGYKKYQLE